MISIVIPIFNEEENLPYLFERTSNVMNSQDDDYEIVLIDDGSTDNSKKIILEKIKQDKRFRLVEFSRNFGHQAAISAGLQAALGDAVAIMDGDMQDPPEEILNFLKKWKEGYQVVYAVRTKRKEGIFKRAAYSIFYRVLKLISDIDIPLDSGDFCVIDRCVVDVLNKEMPERIRFVRGLRAFAGFKQIGVQYERSARYAGVEKYTFKKLIKLALDGIFDFSIFPLRIASYIGYMIAFSSLVIVIFFTLHRILNFKIFGHSPIDNPGIATVVVGIYFLGGLILIILGIIGEYIGRIYYEVKKRPFYVIKKLHENKR